VRTTILWVIVGLTAGAMGGAIFAHRVLTPNSETLSQWLAVAEYENLALLQYKHADTQHARRAMQGLVSFMDRVEMSQLVGDKATFELDRSLANMRLAILDQKSGDIEAYKKHFGVAAEFSQRLGNKDVSEAHMREVVARLDDNLP
jgi:hypothetical protein